MKKLFVLLFVSAAIFTACKDDDPTAEQLKEDIELIEKYLIDSNLTAQSTESGLYYIIEKEGTGKNPTLSSIVKVNYTGKLLVDSEGKATIGEIFDSGTVDMFPLSAYIPGWKEGIPFFKEGGEGTLIIPSKLGYGTQPKPKIPPNSVLIFDIKLVDVKN